MMTPREIAEQCIPEAIELDRLGITIKFHYGMWRHIPEDNTTWVITEYDLIDFLNRSKDNKYCQKTYIPIPDVEWAWKWLKNYTIKNTLLLDIYPDAIEIKIPGMIINPVKYKINIKNQSLAKSLLQAVIWVHKQAGVNF